MERKRTVPFDKLIDQIAQGRRDENALSSLAARLAAMPTKALVRTRLAMHTAASHTLEQQLTLEGGLMRELGWSADYAEGVAAFVEKRAPRFSGA